MLDPTDDDIVVIICMRIDEMEGPATVGSVTRPCDDCGCDISVANSSLKYRKKVPQTMLVCNDCGLLRTIQYRAEHPEEDMVFDAVPGAAKEFTNRIRGWLNAENN